MEGIKPRFCAITANIFQVNGHIQYYDVEIMFHFILHNWLHDDKNSSNVPGVSEVAKFALVINYVMMFLGTAFSQYLLAPVIGGRIGAGLKRSDGEARSSSNCNMSLMPGGGGVADVG